MIAWAVGWQEMALSCFVVVPFIAGLVMLIAGLSTHKRGLWIAGLIVMSVPLAVMLVCAVLALLGHLYSH